MFRRPPKYVYIKHDDYRARYVGLTADHRQFFLTAPFVPAFGALIPGSGDGREFLALYIFDSKGNLLDAQIEDFGPRRTMDKAKSRERHAALLASLGNVNFCRIKLRPFEVERFGVTFGLIAQPPEEWGEGWSVSAMPGDYMSFSWPWRRGTYDT